MFQFCLFVILLGNLSQINSEFVPVFIWGQKTPINLPTLSTLGSNEFINLIRVQSEVEPLTVLFVEDRLSIENFSQCKIKNQSCFDRLNKLAQKSFLPAVEDPVISLKKFIGIESQKSIQVNYDNKLSDIVEALGDEKLLVIEFDSIQNKEEFAKHDEFMSNLYKLLEEKRSNVVAIYTAFQSFIPLNTLSRRVQNDGSGKYKKVSQKVLIASPAHFMFAIGKLSIKKGGATEETDISSASVGIEAPNNGTINAVLTAGAHKIQMTFKLSGGTWRARRNFTYNDNPNYRSDLPVSAYATNSFGCIDLRLINVPEKTKIILEHIQIQMIFDPKTGEEIKKFNRNGVNDCVGFFSPGVAMGLIVAILLFSILIVALLAISNIKTNDKFDDPNGKTITVNDDN